ncbi:hypothetical protein [Nonomuraea insulae]|uniref:Cellulase (Glycosyl hydrolase family 5) n=1 Tax=Nonomuraea insulae TaxID=1616787 RepID=A0ABW1D712_9ACTN
MDGRIRRGERDFVALGVNYHPPTAGCDVWSDWRPGELREDFGRIAAAGLNTVRLFLFWRDAQPAPGQVSSTVLDRLDQAVASAEAAGLACVISMFTIWMNGQVLDLPWRQGRDIWRDPAMLAEEELLAGSVAKTLRGRANLLAYDLGDELWHIDPRASGSLSRQEVVAWQGRLAAVIREQAPGALILQANDAAGTFSQVPFGGDNSAGLDLIGTHGFPSWAPASIESTRCYKATNLVPFLVQAAAAYGTPFVDELGSYGAGEAVTAGYLRAATASVLANGAAGVLVWCWQDIAARREPYLQRPMERNTGLNRLDGTPKPAMSAYQEVVADAPRLTQPRSPAEVAIYLPERTRAGGGGYLDAPASTVAAFYAYLLVKRAHLNVELVAGEPVGQRLVLCPSPAHLTLTDLERIERWARAGATVYLSLGDHLHGFAGQELVGAEIVDFNLQDATKDELSWGCDTWPLHWDNVPTVPTTMRAVRARTLAVYPDGSPALVQRRLGSGQILFTNAPIESQLDQPGLLEATSWQRFYERLAALAGLTPEVGCSDPDVEVIPRPGGSALVINHLDRAADVELYRNSARRTVSLASKGWATVDFSS